MYQAITEEDRTELVTALYNQVLKDSWDERKEKNGEYLVCYCKIQDAAFTTEMTENEIKTSARLTIDILEELKNINNTGLNKEKFNTLLKQYTTENAGITGYLGIWDEVFRTEKIQLIFSEIDRIKQVGGAYAAILAHPQLIQTIIAIYDVLVDSFDDEHLYCTSAYFLLRGIMRMRSRET